MTTKKFVPVMLTPFEDGNAIDYTILEDLIEFYLKAGAGGLFANCLSSEMYHLSREEMLASVSFIVQKVNGRVPIVATGTFPDTLDNQAAFVKEMYHTGVDSVIVITSLLAEETESEDVFEARVNQLLALTDDIPLGFYECPVPYKRILRSDFLGELVRTGRINYHKDTSLNINSVRAKIAASKDAEDFALYDAYMGHAVDSMKADAAGLSCIQGNYFPELIVWLCNHYGDDSEEVDKVQQFFAQNMSVMHDTYPASAKYILEKRGLGITQICRNGSELKNTADYDKLDTLYCQFNALAQEIKLNMVSL
ncbi:dihydrodipicolinate synthase family protein [Spirosoma sp. KCTC 42546]|uniref:dihydrodipicolinate synthase family protein n=1 Tax=Spirosoma sp. KCTC 42546 TaxID=2520506 RepID=UPI001157D6B3|nr:dihydrodipicolinate synthase family protein [Spirosoma sp. KCTC 42546]QDK77568.1 dihydrodipicolinate synthase family protein [Spirosoma sp. KCTC 42546]